MTSWEGDGGTYDRRFEALAQTGQDVHGEADFIEQLVPRPESVLDAGCGTGRVAIELARRGCAVVGVDIDRSMLDVGAGEGARARVAPSAISPRSIWAGTSTRS